MSDYDLEKFRNQLYEKVKQDIREHGFHMSLVAGGPLPTYCYTIGLSEQVGFEIALAGASYLEPGDIPFLLKEVAEVCLEAKDVSVYEFETVGRITLAPVEKSWTREIGLGAVKWYKNPTVALKQIVLDKRLRTIDFPDLSKPLDVEMARPWRWLQYPWTEIFDENSLAEVDYECLFGRPLGRVTRCEENRWRMEASAERKPSFGVTRSVPMGTVIAVDESVRVLAGRMKVGSSMTRSRFGDEWIEEDPSVSVCNA